MKMNIICSDLEGVFVPEFWIKVAIKTGIEELKLTTRDIADYDVLMNKRLAILKENGLKLKDITDVIATIDPLPGAAECLDWIRKNSQIIILSDTFSQFAGPLMEKLGMPTILCHTLTIDSNGSVSGYNLRQDHAKHRSVLALKGLNYHVTAFGDSYNDVEMVQEADHGFFFCPPDNVIQEFPDYPVTQNYDEVKDQIKKALSL